MLYNISHIKIKRPYRAIMLVVIGFLLLSTSFIPKTAKASNPYISNINFYKDSEGFTKLKFFVNTTWTNKYSLIGVLCYNISYTEERSDGKAGAIFDGTNVWGTAPFFAIAPDSAFIGNGTCIGNYTWTAGNTYEVYLISGASAFSSTYTLEQMKSNNKLDKTNWTTTNYFMLTGGDYWTYGHYQIPTADSEKYYFIEMPTINITYPLDNAEIAEAFYITGSYSVPDLESYSRLYIWLQYENLDIYPFVKTLDAVSGTLNERIAGLPAGNYNIRFVFADGTAGLYEIPAKIPISILEAIPPELPETEEPESPFFNILDGQIYYSSFSNYPTSTNLYSSLINTIQPVMSAIGNNLNYFGDKFNQDNAKDTGEKTGKAVLLIRSYTNNLNSFFSDLPVSQFLLFYLILLMASIVFRIIRALINLIKP